MKVRVRVYPNGKKRWEVDLGLVQGKRTVRGFGSRVEAEAFLAAAKTKRRDEGMSALSLGRADEEELRECREKVQAVGGTLRQAVAFFLEHHKPTAQTMPLPELLAAFLAAKERQGSRPLYVKMLRSTLGAFVSRHAGKPLNEIRPEVVKRYLEDNEWSGKTRKNVLGDIRAFWGWLVQEGQLAKNLLSQVRLDAVPRERAEIGAFGATECAALLRAGMQPEHRRLLGFLVLGLFAGVRPEEINRSGLGELDLMGRVFVVEGLHAKTRSRRVLELHRVAVLWLRLWRWWCPGQTQFVEVNHKKRFARLRADAGVNIWPHDALRHTFASMHLAAFQDVPRLQYLMGHYKGEDTLFAHYRATKTTSGERISKRGADEFWGLTPKRVKWGLNKLQT